MSNDWDRRLFLKRLGAAGVGVTSVTTAALMLRDEGRAEPLPSSTASQVRNFQTGLEETSRKLVVSHFDDPGQATHNAIEALGGMGTFVNPGDKVVLKPNAAWDRTPMHAANTNPAVIGALVKMCFESGASHVTVTDNTCHEAKRAFERSGIKKAAEEAGAEVILPAAHRFALYDLGGVILHKMPVLGPAIDADRFINVPIAKHHGLSGFSGAMKNLYGVLGGRRNRLHQRIDDSIADLADFIRPTLTVMDATRVLLRNGPVGGNVEDTAVKNQVIASMDQVAVDAYSCSLIGLTPADLPYLAKAQSRHLGTADLSLVELTEVRG